MKSRCLNKNANGFHNYGGRGIKVCDRWLESFENFLADMGHRLDDTSLERRDNNGGYCPENCYWATNAEQNANTRRTRRFVVAGMAFTLREAADFFGIPHLLIKARLRDGFSEIDAVSLPKYAKRFWRRSLELSPKLI